MEIADTEVEKISEKITQVKGAIAREAKAEEDKKRLEELNDAKSDLLGEMKAKFESVSREEGNGRVGVGGRR
jgi:hypothetical protein